MRLFKLLNGGSKIDGKMYRIIRTLYSYTESCVNVNGYLTSWFRTLQGVKQGDNLSPTLFSIFINDLAISLKNLNLGVKFGELTIPILMYADDVAIISDNKDQLQTMLNLVDTWCKQWGMNVNMSKTKVIHFRKKGSDRCEQIFKLGERNIDYISEYKYLGVFFDEFIDFNKHVMLMSESGTRALGAPYCKI